MPRESGARRVVLATFGSHGDVHPFLAVALRLRALGLRPVLAASALYREQVESEGIEFCHMRPDPDAVVARLGMTQSQLVRAVRKQPQFLLRQLLLPHLAESYQDSLACIAGADLVVTHSAAYGARIAAEKLGVPTLAIVLQPMLFLSAFDPPRFDSFRGGPSPRLTRAIYRLGPAWTRACFALGKRWTRHWAKPIDELRAAVGLPAQRAHPFFEGQFTATGALGLYSSVLGEVQPDMPAGTRIVGFAQYDRQQGRPLPLPPSLIQFLSPGPPPLIFTLGTSAVHDATQFMQQALAAVRALYARAIFVLDAERQHAWSQHASPDVMITGYVPYSLLFPHAQTIVHHGGIGTLAQALRAGRPQLVVPHLVDQPDNAHRMTRLGVALTLDLERFHSTNIVAALQQLERDPTYAERAAVIGERVRHEDGAQAAAQFIIEVIERAGRAGGAS
jgi:UDP:flavonoid glycosyltransferase YjiC (YdhE family)